VAAGRFRRRRGVGGDRDGGVQVAEFVLKRNIAERVEELRWSVPRLSLPGDHSVPPAIVSLAEREGVLEWAWKEVDRPISAT